MTTRARQDDQYLWINVTGNFTTNHGCAQRWYARSKHQLADERTQVQLRMASASFLSRSAVYVWTEGCTSTTATTTRSTRTERDGDTDRERNVVGPGDDVAPRSTS